MNIGTTQFQIRLMIYRENDKNEGFLNNLIIGEPSTISTMTTTTITSTPTTQTTLPGKSN